ncbi:MAG TPA: metalloprotease PmbA [Gammaproteobacteria bacterium]|nr:metalloprotease PmbA [Gammaproteobacteria bacterium]
MEFIDNQEELKTLVEDILKEARRQGADQSEVSVSMDQGLGVSVRKGSLENLEFNQDRGFGITLYFGHRKGSASTTDSSREAIAATVSAARDIARHTQDDECSGLAEPELMPEQAADLDLYHPWEITPEAATEIAIGCEAAGLAVDARLKNSDGAEVSSQQSIRVYGNSHGFIGAYAGTRHSLSCVLIGEDASGMQRDYWYTQARSHQDMEDALTVGRIAGERTAGRLSPRSAPTGSFPVLFAAPQAAGLIGHLVGAIGGSAQYRKATFLLDALGEQVLPKWLTLKEHPLRPKALGSAYFDADGVATRENTFISEGILDSYALSVYSGKKLARATTGNAGGVHNLELMGAAESFENLLSRVDKGLYVTELMGQGVNSVTGDYSRGAAGYWVEDGKIQYPVDELTIAGNLRDMYLNVLAMGDDADRRGNILSPSLLIERMTIAGQ